MPESQLGAAGVFDPYAEPQVVPLELSSPVVTPVSPDEDTAEMPVLQPHELQQHQAASAAGTVETQAGLVWLNRIGAVTLIFGVAYFFKYAIDNEWIGPAGRVIIGVLMAALAIFGGDRLWHKGHKVFAQGITALGVCVLFLSFWAAFSLYNLIPQGAAFVLLLVATAASGALALRYNARVIALLALAGGHATPFLVSTGEPNDIFFGCYMLVINLVVTQVARRQNWRIVEILALASTVALHGAWFSERADKFGHLWASLFAAGQYAIFALQPVRWQHIVAQLFAAAGIAAVWESDSWNGAFFLSAALIPAIGLGWSVLKKQDVYVLGSLFAWIITFAAWIDTSAHQSGYWLACTVGFVAFLATILFVRYQPLGVPGFAALGLNGIVYYAISYHLLDKDHHGYMGLLAVAVAATYLFAATKLRESASPKAALLGAGLALAFLTLAIPVQLKGFSITLAWAMEAAALAFLAARLNSFWALGGSWVVAWLAFMRLQLIDQNEYWPQPGEPYTLFFNPRFIPFLASAVAFGLVGYFTTRVQNVQKFLPAIPAVLMHLTLLWGLHLEAFAYIGASHGIDSDVSSMKALASTILLALYGVLLVAGGILKSEPFHRLLGLGLFALVILKLYTFDIWLLGRIYRIVAFVVLGGLLVASSYLYSRYRNRIVALLKNETPSS